MNFFGVLGQLGRLLPGYVEGRRQAIQDNWQDLSNYNQIQHGQMKNAFEAATFENQLANNSYMSDLARLSAMQSLGNFNLWQATYPWKLQNAVPNYLQQNGLSQIVSNYLTNRMMNPPQQQQPVKIQQGVAPIKSAFDRLRQP